MRWFRRRSLRARLSFICAAGLAVGLLAGGLLILTVLNYVLVHSLDAGSRQTAREVGALVEANSTPVLIPSAGTSLVQVLDGAGHIRAATAGADRLVPLLSPAELTRVESGGVVAIAGSRVGVSGTLRVVARVAGAGPDERVVLVAAPTHTVEESNEAVRAILLIVYPLLVAGLTLLAWRVVGWALRPVEELRQGAERISAAGRRAGPLPVPDGDDEVHRLAVTLNDMLDRLDAGRARQRAFVADAAHELRSPIASLRTQLEVAERLGEPPPAADLVTDVARLSRLVDDLLLLARADEGDPSPRLDEAVDLAAIARDVAASQAGARVPVTVIADGPVWTVGDPAAMRRIVDNLVANAVRHAMSEVTVSASAAAVDAGGGSGSGGGGSSSGGVRLRVRDDGPGIPAADRERVFDRFTRLDNARARDQGGAGLGLAIVRELTRQHAGTVTLGDAEPGLRADVTLPEGAPPS